MWPRPLAQPRVGGSGACSQLRRAEKVRGLFQEAGDRGRGCPLGAPEQGLGKCGMYYVSGHRLFTWAPPSNLFFT